jgi:hypothetical protein
MRETLNAVRHRGVVGTTRALGRRLRSRSPLVWRRSVDERLATLDELERRCGELQGLEARFHALAVAHHEVTHAQGHGGRAFPTWVPPGHFYSPFPDLDDYEARVERLFDPGSEPAGIDLREADQLDLLEELGAIARDPTFPDNDDGSTRYWFDNPSYAWGDGVVLHAMLRHLEPRKVIEVGSGYSSALILDTVDGWLGGATDVTFIEPYPELLRSLLRPGDEDRVTVLDQPVQDVDLELFTELGPRDVLFIDSTHVVKPGSDVNHLTFEVLPRLRANVWIHIHDMFFPFEYPPPWVREGRAWQEAYLMRAFLMFNARFVIRWFQGFLVARHQELLLQRLPPVAKNSGGNLWLETLG